MRGLIAQTAAALVAALPGIAWAIGPADTSSIAGEVSDARPYSLSLGVQLRTLAVSDEDPANDRGLYYKAELGWKVTDDIRGFIRAGVTHRFVQVGTSPAVRFTDMLIGFGYTTDLELAADQKIELAAQLGLYLPTSRVSQRQSLYAAPDLSLGASWAPLDWLSVDMGVHGNYRFMQFAERAGPGGTLNTQLVMGGSLGLAVIPYKTDESRVSLGASVSTNLRKRYEAADVFESPNSDAVYWDQFYGWSLFAAWSPLKWLTATVALEQGGPVVRDGVVNVFFTKLEETELVVGLAARY